MLSLYLPRAFAPAGAPAPSPAPAIPQDMIKSIEAVGDIIGTIVSFFITLASIPRVWNTMPVAATNDDMLSVPLLQVRDHGVSARRYQNWLAATVLHSLTIIFYTYKDQLQAEVSKSSWTLFFKYSGPSTVLIVSFVLLIMLMWYYPITQVAWVVVGSICMSYLLIVLTDKLYLKNTITSEIMLIPLTVCMHTLRFVGQGASTKIDVVALLVAALGVIPGIFCIIKLGFELLKDDILHVAFKIATLLGAGFRLLDVMFICCDPVRDKANYLRSRLQECFI